MKIYIIIRRMAKTKFKYVYGHLSLANSLELKLHSSNFSIFLTKRKSDSALS